MASLSVTAVTGTNPTEPENSTAVTISSLEYAFPGLAPVIGDFSMKLPAGSRCLLCGANGAGKTTLLQVLAGKHMVNRSMLCVLGRSPFHDTAMTCSGELAFLGGSWKAEVAYAGEIALACDITAREMIFGVVAVNPARRDRLINLLDIDLDWNLMRTSDGQRRRVQICMGLLKEYSVLLMDEVTVDLDVLSRLDLLRFFEEECSERGATIIYATHIFDGMEKWATHLAYVEEGSLKRGGPTGEIPDLNAGKRLLDVMEGWLRVEFKERKERKKIEPAANCKPKIAAPFMPSKHMAFYR